MVRISARNALLAKEGAAQRVPGYCSWWSGQLSRAFFEWPLPKLRQATGFKDGSARTKRQAKVRFWSAYVFIAGPIAWLGLILAQAGHCSG